MTKTLRFGKYKGRTVAEILAYDPEYLRWLCSQDWFRNDHRTIYQDIIDYVEGLADAHERKAMRARFQDADFCRRFLQTAGYEDTLLHELNSKHAQALKEIADSLRYLKETTSKAKNYSNDPSYLTWARTNGIFLDPVDRERQIAGFEQIAMARYALHKRMPNQCEPPPEPKISCRFEQHGFGASGRRGLEADEPRSQGVEPGNIVVRRAGGEWRNNLAFHEK